MSRFDLRDIYRITEPIDIHDPRAVSGKTEENVWEIV